MESSPENLKAFHLAGIIPVSGQILDFGMDWSDCLIPIAENYTAIENSVMECAWAGCETIWLVCNDDVSPLIRYRIGDYVQDPVHYGRTFDPRPSATRKPIPIYYVPTHPNDRDRRDCLGWCVIHGAATAYKISLQLSKWVIPDKYYVSFPHGVFPVEFLRKYRDEISSKQRFYLTHDEKTIKDGEYLSFTFGSEDFINFKKNFRKEATNMYVKGEKRRLSSEKRYSGRFFSLDKVFKNAILRESKMLTLPWYYNIGSWNQYCEFLGSSERKLITRPKKCLLSYRELNPVGLNDT